MIQALIISIVIGIVTNGIQVLIGYFKSKKIESLDKDLRDARIKLANEIRRSQEKQQQVSDMLEFQSNDSAIKTRMDINAEFLKNARSKDSVKEGLKKVSINIRNIFNGQ